MNFQIVKEIDEGVIHNTHNADYRRTVEARRVHLERLNSMPNMKVSADLLQTLNPERDPGNPGNPSPKSGLSPLREEQEIIPEERDMNQDTTIDDAKKDEKDDDKNDVGKKKMFKHMQRWNSTVEFSKAGLLHAISLGRKDNML